MTARLRPALLLASTGLLAVTGGALAAPGNPKAGPPPPAVETGCLDIVGGGGSFTPDYTALPNGTQVASSGTVTWRVELAAASCLKGGYSTTVYTQRVLDPATGAVLVPPRAIGTSTVKGDGVSPFVDFTLQVSDPAILAESLTTTPEAFCLEISSETTGRGGTADLAPDTGSVPVCPGSPATQGFY